MNTSHRRLAILVLWVAIPLTPVWAADSTPSGTGTPSTPPTAKAYTDDEFEPWIRDLRRAEIITVGAFPIAFLLLGLGYDYYYYFSNGLPQDNFPWPVGPGTSQWTTTTQADALKAKNMTLIGASAVVGLVLAGLDWWLGR